jgi:hypothetical protein
MPKLVRVFTGSTGLNNKIDPARLKYDSKKGVQELAAAYNVDVDDTGRVSRRKGFTERLSASAHSLFCDGGECLFVIGDALCLLESDYTYTALRNITPGVPMNYCQVEDIIYYCNGYERGKVYQGTSYGWNKGTYVGPDTTRELSDPPIGTDLDFHASRMFVVQSNVAWYSEPFDISAFDLTRNYLPFEDSLVMFRSVETGIYASTDKHVYYLSGKGVPKEYEKVTVSDYPAIKGSEVKFTGSFTVLRSGKFNISTRAGTKHLIWLSNEGVFLGTPAGAVYNLTEDKIDLPDALTGAGLVYKDKFTGIMNP